MEKEGSWPFPHIASSLVCELCHACALSCHGPLASAEPTLQTFVCKNPLPTTAWEARSYTYLYVRQCVHPSPCRPCACAGSPPQNPTRLFQKNSPCSFCSPERGHTTPPPWFVNVDPAQSLLHPPQSSSFSAAALLPREWPFWQPQHWPPFCQLVQPRCCWQLDS